MKRAACWLRWLVFFSAIIDGCLLMIVNNEITGISQDIVPTGVRFLVFPLAVLTCLAGMAVGVHSFFTKKNQYILLFAAILLNLISMMLLFIGWMLIIRLYLVPIGSAA
jgi:hypothetical protein